VVWELFDVWRGAGFCADWLFVIPLPLMDMVHPGVVQMHKV